MHRIDHVLKVFFGIYWRPRGFVNSEPMPLTEANSIQQSELFMQTLIKLDNSKNITNLKT